ncbi:helix-turn-helix domain-containing protein [Phytohabitans kaempferiae]|uniref:Helix-turn-helix domain-containing protein n=1 Tax=Phytohabitans kaempferiae TaxID=1620943 RepID=A0ABV6M7M0_9ACTN
MSAPDRRELATRLRDLRKAAGLSTTQLAAQLGWSQSKVSKIENGRTKPAVADVNAWLTAVDAPASQRPELLDMAESIQVASIIWDRTLGGGRAAHQREIGLLRDQATEVRVFQNGVVPGLLQTAAYARAVLNLADIFQLGDTTRAAAARIDRQAVLYEEGRRFQFVITEAALRFRPGDVGMLVAQYDKILSTCTLPTIDLAILPTGTLSSTVHAHPFVIYSLPENSTVVTIETYTRELTLTDQEEVGSYERVYRNLQTDAIQGAEAQRFLVSLRDKAAASMAAGPKDRSI